MRLSGMDLNLLLALDALLSERNVTRAGERLSVGQPAMSGSLARLRKHFGDPLLVREGVTTRLTPLAESLVEPVRHAIEAAAAVLDRNLEANPEEIARTYTIVASEYVLLVLLRQVIEAIADQAPGIDLQVEPISPGYRDQLRRGHADFLIMPAEVTGRDLGVPAQQLFTDRYVLVGDAGNPALSAELSVAEFLALPYADYAGGPMPSVATARLDALGLTRHVVIATQSFAALPLLLPGTRFVSLMQYRLASLAAPSAGLRWAEPPVALAPLHEVLHWHPRHTGDPAHRWVRAQLLEFASGLDAVPAAASPSAMDGIDANY